VADGRLARDAALVFADWLDDRDQGPLAAAVRALARAELVAAEDWPPAPARPDGLAVTWAQGFHARVWLFVRTAVPWLPVVVDRVELRCCQIWVVLTGRTHLYLRWHPHDSPEPSLREDDQYLSLAVPPRYPLAALAGLAYEAWAAVLLARLLGHYEATEERVVVRP
jgi:hypothetical protein